MEASSARKSLKASANVSYRHVPARVKQKRPVSSFSPCSTALKRRKL